MAFPQESANAELHKEARSANEERASSCYHSSSSAISSSYEGAYERANSRQDVDGAAAMDKQPPPTQQMDRQSSDGAAAAGDPGRIPSAVFERDPSESNKDWSMMSTDSVFALQVAPSSDFTGFFLAHPELMDISTPPRTSAVAADEAVLAPHLENIPDLGEATMMKGNYSFAFPNLIEDNRYSSKKSQEQPASPPATATATAEAATAEAETSSKPEAAPGKAAAKGGLLSCFPCCSS